MLILLSVGKISSASDVTSIVASEDIVYGYNSNAGNERVELGGPGYLVVQSGRKIDLGLTGGIKTVGNFINQALDRVRKFHHRRGRYLTGS